MFWTFILAIFIGCAQCKTIIPIYIYLTKIYNVNAAVYVLLFYPNIKSHESFMLLFVLPWKIICNITLIKCTFVIVKGR